MHDSDIQAVSLLITDFESLGSESLGDLFFAFEGCWCSNTAQDSFILLMPSRYLQHVIEGEEGGVEREWRMERGEKGWRGERGERKGKMN